MLILAFTFIYLRNFHNDKEDLQARLETLLLGDRSQSWLILDKLLVKLFISIGWLYSMLHGILRKNDFLPGLILQGLGCRTFLMQIRHYQDTIILNSGS